MEATRVDPTSVVTLLFRPEATRQGFQTTISKLRFGVEGFGTLAKTEDDGMRIFEADIARVYQFSQRPNPLVLMPSPDSN